MSVPTPGEDAGRLPAGLDYITEQPPNAGVPLSVLDGSSLPQDRVYLRNSFPMPLPGEVSGEIEVVLPGEERRALTPSHLASLPQVTVEMVLECAGNGRSLMVPVPTGLPWNLGGVSPIRVSGPRLGDAIGPIPNEVVALVFTGYDRGEVKPEGEVHYQFSIDADLARSGLPLLVTHIGDEPLAHQHGGPVRLIVPGHYAMKSVKWLTRIEGTSAPFEGHFVKRYRYRGDAEMPEEAPVGPIQVRSLIAHPGEGQALEAGTLPISGSAWSGEGEIVSVLVSADAGRTWSEAELSPGEGPVAATAWRHRVELPPGSHVLMSRATDSIGKTQPLDPRWNAQGYANNVVHRVTVDVV